MTDINYRFPKKYRLKENAAFQRVYNAKQAKGDAHLLIFAARNSVGYTRLGVSVSRKVGNAVARARFKRCLREAFRLEYSALPVGLDLILIPRRGTTADTDTYRASLRKLMKQLTELITRNDRRSSRNQETNR
ncbi:MAG: ribonuclease P protein component [Planctomycetaceae bacterium]|nr:ribonuclease P protein component [Planctomycetaceae bacterium]